MPFPYPFPIIFGVWPAVAVVIGAEIQDLKKGSLSVELRIEERSIAEFTLVDRQGTATYQKGQPVAIYDKTDTRIFGGVIETPEKVAMSPKGGLWHPVRCIDWHYLADKRLVASSYLNKTPKYIITDIITKYLASEGVSIGEIEASTDTENWTLPTGFTDPDGAWTDEPKAYDDDLATWAICLVAGNSWGSFLQLEMPENSCNQVRFYATSFGGDIDEVDIDIYYDSAWHHIFQGAFATGMWEVYSCSSQFITEARIRFHNDAAPGGFAYLRELQFDLGLTIKEVVFNYARASDCFDKLAVLANKIWFIDEYKALYFQARDTTDALWSADAATNIDNCRWSGGNPKYRNRQYIRGGKATTTLEQTENFIGDAKQNAFTVQYPLAKTPSGATGSIKVAGGADLTMGIKGLDAPGDFQAYWNKGDKTIYITTTPGLADAIEVKYYGLYDILVLVEDAGAIAAQLAVEGSGTGYVEEISDEPKLIDQDASIDAGKAKLAKFAVAGQRLLYSTVETGLKPGQLQPVTYTAFGLTATDMLIEAVSVWTDGENHVVYEITAIQGPVTGSWTDYFKALAAMKHEIIERLNVGSEQILIILAEFEGHVAVSGELTDVDIFVCHVIGTARIGTATIC